jgi:hypothetical protein
MKSIMLIVLMRWIGFEQEPPTIRIINPESVSIAYSRTFAPNEIREAAKYSCSIKEEITADGHISNGQMVKIDSGSILFRKRDVLLREIEKRMRIEIYSDAMKQKIRQSHSHFCISLLVSKGTLFDYENHPFKCE